MYKDLKEHAALVTRRSDGLTAQEASVLLKYHIGRVRDFQHERLVHLLVTLFFGFLVIMNVTALFLVREPGIMQLMLSGLLVILLITELCYVWYYYLLENGVQGLYKITNQLESVASQAKKGL